MAPAGAALIAEAKKRGRWDTAYRLRERQNTPQDLEEALSRNREALENFNNFAPGYKNQYIFWVNDAKQVETRKRRIIEVVKRAAENKKPGSK
jgi:uncharacterized protein YdeI (YjbR/CyaY-like superfamily)